MHRPRALRARLFFWFLGAIFLAIGATWVVLESTRPAPITGAEAMASHVSERLAQVWEDGDATRAYVGEVRDVTGFEVRLLRDARQLPRSVRRAAWVGRFIVGEHGGHILVPVVRRGELLGALEMEKFGPRPQAWWRLWWHVLAALAATLLLLSAMAGGAANRLARPLEQLALAADRLGAGDLRFRATPPGRRWGVAEVRDVAVSFNRMADRVEAIVRGQRELLGAISHELRSPLARARVALEIARERAPGPPPAPSTSEPLDDLEKQLGAIDALLGDLLDVTRAGLADLRRTPQELTAWVRARLKEEPTPPPLDLRVAPECEALELSFDGPMLARALHNLLLNARVHGHPPEEPLQVRVERGPSSVRVVVRDRGPGFPDEIVRPQEGGGPAAFEPFVRGDSARSRPASGAGSGLGLAIVRRIVEAHGGRAFIGNAEDAGAEAGFELPLDAGAR